MMMIAPESQPGGSPFIRVTDLSDVSGNGGSEVILCRPFPPEGVTLVYTHSMFGGDVRETFVPSGQSLRRVEMTTANGAAADYYAFTVDVTRVGDRYRVDVPPEDFQEIVVRVDDVGNHRLIVAGETIDMVAAAGNAHPVRLDVVRESWTTQWWVGVNPC